MIYLESEERYESKSKTKCGYITDMKTFDEDFDLVK